MSARGLLRRVAAVPFLVLGGYYGAWFVFGFALELVLAFHRFGR